MELYIDVIFRFELMRFKKVTPLGSSYLSCEFFALKYEKLSNQVDCFVAHDKHSQGTYQKVKLEAE